MSRPGRRSNKISIDKAPSAGIDLIILLQNDIKSSTPGFGGGEIDFTAKMTLSEDFHAVGPQPPLGPFRGKGSHKYLHFNITRDRSGIVNRKF